MTSNPDQKTRVLIVSLPGFMQNMLCETFNNRLDVDLVGVAGGGLSAVSTIQKQQPDLVVIDSSVPVSEATALILWMKEEYHHARSLVLVETTQQSNKAAHTGADIILRSYSLGDHLERVLEDLRSK
jgi:chemotaxis response regulator CheB